MDQRLERILERIGARYRAWAEDAHDRCPLYENLANAVAGDPLTLEFLSRLPEPKQQPNLLFGAVKYERGAQPDWASFRRMVEAHQEPMAWADSHGTWLRWFAPAGELPATR